MKDKDSVMEDFKEDNLKMQTKVENLVQQLSENKLYLNKLDQCNRRNNIEIQDIPSSIPDDALENKVNNSFKSLCITVQNIDIEGCHSLGKAYPQNTIGRFINRKLCYEALEKKPHLKHVISSDFGFESN